MTPPADLVLLELFYWDYFWLMKALQLIHLLLRSNLQFDVSSVEVKAMLQFFGKLQNQNLLIFDLYG